MGRVGNTIVLMVVIYGTTCMKHFSSVLSEQRQKHFNWNYISLSLLLPTKQLQFVSNQLWMCIKSTLIGVETT